MLLLFVAFACLGLIGEISAVCDVASETRVSGKFAPSGIICGGDLLFEDTFDEFDLRKWSHDLTLWGGGNGEFEWYNNNRSNSYAQDGNLHIRPTLLADETGNEYLISGTLDINGGAPTDTCTNAANNGCSRTGTPENILNPIKSARISTVDSFSFRYGKVEVRAKLPAGDWLWPAIWMLPRFNQYAGWPASGEIDIMESRGNRELYSVDGVNIGTQQVGSTLHWGPNYNNNKFMLTHFERNNASGYDADFHTYSVEWTSEKLAFAVDGDAIGTVAPPGGGFWELGDLASTGIENPWRGSSNRRMAPFDQEFHIIINLAVGGYSYFPDNASNPGGKPWKNDSPTQMADFWNGREQWLSTWNLDTDDSHLQVDYVRVYAV